MKKRLFCLFLALTLVLAPLSVSADQGAVIRCDSPQGQPGDYLYFPITAENLENLAALELSLFYDPQVLEYAYCSNGWLLDSAMASTNHREGEVTLTAISADGISGSGDLLYVSFLVKQDCLKGRYPLTLAVGEAYDVNRQAVAISAKSGWVTVTEYAPSYSEFRLGLELDRSTLSPGEIVTATVSNAWWCSYASFDLSVHYDASMFRLVSAEIPEEFDRQNAVCSLNTTTDGLVRLTCACVNSLWEYEMLKLQFEVREGAIGTTAMTAEIRDVCDSNRFPYLPGSAQAELTVIPAQSVRLPQLWLAGGTPVVGEETTSTLVLGEGSGLAAADFELRYDPLLLECLAVEPAGDAQFLLINPNFSDGSIRFSFVEEAGVTEETALVRIRWRARTGADRHYTIETVLTDPVNAQFQGVAIDCAPQSGCIYIREITDPTCETPGGEQLCCVSCGALVPVAPQNPLGHDYGDAVFHWADDFSACSATRVCARDGSHVWQVACTVTHVSQGSSCDAPGSIIYTASADFYGEDFTDQRTVHLDKLGHDYTWTVLTEPGCTTEGKRFGTCIRCDATCTESIAPLGHDYRSQVTEPGCTEGGYTTHTCTRCGHSYTDSQTDSIGHRYAWFLMTPPDCTEEGVEQGKCSGCGDTQTRAVPALGHDWNGSTCRRCGEFHGNPFTDVSEKSFYYNPVLWAVANGITTGVSATTFAPEASCTRGQVVTFLWRAAGKPEPMSTNHPFTDVKAGAFYYKAMLWAVENGITSGMDATHFAPDAFCTRAQLVTFLYRAMGKPAISSATHPFTDVNEKGFYYQPMLWAVENQITSGMTATSFAPDRICTRGQVVTFLYRTFLL